MAVSEAPVAAAQKPKVWPSMEAEAFGFSGAEIERVLLAVTSRAANAFQIGGPGGMPALQFVLIFIASLPTLCRAQELPRPLTSFWFSSVSPSADRKCN